MATTTHGIIYPGPDQMGEDGDVPTTLGLLASSADDALTDIDADIAAVAASAVPIGAIIAYGGLAAPANWCLCDGSAHGSAALEAVLGSPNAPDLRDRFVVGAGTTYSRGNTGGVASVTLTAAQSGLVGHTHAATAIAEAAHTHSINPPATSTSSDAHTHTLNVRDGSGSGDGNYVDTAPTDGGSTKTLTNSATSSDSHNHTVDIAAFTSGAGSSHGHAITVAAVTAAAASQAHENRPPYWALTFIIKKA